MIASFIITFRETLEAALIIGIILAYLARTKKQKYNILVYLGTIAAIILSITAALIFRILSISFEGTAEQIFEGITMLLAAFLLTFMILWMMKRRHVAHEIREHVSEELQEKHKLGLFFIAFIAVLREGIETVLFLGALTFTTGKVSIFGGFAGIVLAIFLGYAFFRGTKKINLKIFFSITSILLILFAAGLVAHGVHEFEEARIIPTVVEHVWDINPPINPDGSYPLLHEKGYIGSIAKGLFGYNGDPSLIEVLSYIAYLILIFILWRNIEKVHKVI